MIAAITISVALRSTTLSSYGFQSACKQLLLAVLVKDAIMTIAYRHYRHRPDKIWKLANILHSIPITITVVTITILVVLHRQS